MEDYEKKYKNALEKAKSMIDDLRKGEDILAVSDLETLIPELKESEDEKIRKTIIRFFKDNYPNETEMYDGSVTVGKAIAWLEKQGGNPAPININKMVMEYSQTKDGDLGLPVNCQIRAYRQGLTDAISTLNLEKQGSITKLNEEEENKLAKVVLTSCAESFINYLDAHKKEGKMCVSNGECEDIENAFHNAMWDRLHRYYCKYIEKQGVQKPVDKIRLEKKYKCIASPRYSTFMVGKIYKPEDKFLCSLMNFYSDCFEPIEDSEQEPAWSEEDSKRIDYICDFIWKNRKGDTDEIYQQEQDVNWLKSLKNRVKPQSKEWSEEDEHNLNGIIDEIRANQNEGPSCDIKTYNRFLDWLKSIKDRVQPQHNQAWSEEDERIKKRILLSLEKDLMATKNSGCDTQDLEQCIAWLEKQGESSDQIHYWTDE